LWRELKDHLQDKHGISVQAYETGARAGHTIRDILEDLARDSTFAILVFTAEDEQPDGTFRARQNVVHEAGLFQGKLGFSRAIILLEDGVQQFSNIAGIQYIPFSRGNIREAYGDVVATINREFQN
jgi:predicted nucleotide-binding protein